MPWVEFCGGPYEGTMTEIAESSGDIVVYGPRTNLPDGRHRVGPARGQYIRRGRVLDDLDVTRMEWTDYVPDDRKGMEGLIVGRRKDAQ